MKEGASETDGNGARSFQAEEPNAGVAVSDADVGSQVGLVKGG